MKTKEKIAQNGNILTYSDTLEIWLDGAGERGYKTFYTGAYVCYTCGYLCDCGWGEQE